LHHQHAAQPRGSPSGRKWSPGLPSQVRARDPAPTLCRALMMQAASLGSYCLVGVARKKLFEYLAECCSDVELREDSQPAQPNAMDQQITRGQVQLHGHSA
jgi:hypothetical protein